MLGQAALLICLLIVGTEAYGQKVKTTLKYQSAYCLSPFENLLTIRKFQNVDKFQILVFLYCYMLETFKSV